MEVYIRVLLSQNAVVECQNLNAKPCLVAGCNNVNRVERTPVQPVSILRKMIDGQNLKL